jgi:hypothetical protein
MKLNLDSDLKSSSTKKKVLLISLLVILLIGIVAWLSNQVLQIRAIDRDISEFNQELEELATVEYGDATPNIIQDSNLQFLKDSIYKEKLAGRSPFKSQLQLKPDPPEKDTEKQDDTEKQEEDSEVKEVEVVDSSSAEESKDQEAEEKKTEAEKRQELKEKIGENLRSKLKIMGVLSKNGREVVIIKYGEQGTQLVEPGSKFAGFKVEEIVGNKLIIREQENDFTYTIGGEDD